MIGSTPTNPPPLDQVDRVRRHTPAEANRQIDEATAERVRYLAAQPVETIALRLEALEREWDVERVLETNASSLALVGLTFTALFGRKWLIIPFAVAGFLLQHALQGWCPPIMLIRPLGFRTRREIEAEKTALRIVRGDFASPTPAEGVGERANTALRAAGVI